MKILLKFIKSSHLKAVKLLNGNIFQICNQNFIKVQLPSLWFISVMVGTNCVKNNSTTIQGYFQNSNTNFQHFNISLFHFIINPPVPPDVQDLVIFAVSILRSNVKNTISSMKQHNPWIKDFANHHFSMSKRVCHHYKLLNQVIMSLWNNIPSSGTWCMRCGIQRRWWRNSQCWSTWQSNCSSQL